MPPSSRPADSGEPGAKVHWIIAGPRDATGALDTTLLTEVFEDLRGRDLTPGAEIEWVFPVRAADFDLGIEWLRSLDRGAETLRVMRLDSDSSGDFLEAACERLRLGKWPSRVAFLRDLRRQPPSSSAIPDLEFPAGDPRELELRGSSYRGRLSLHGTPP